MFRMRNILVASLLLTALGVGAEEKRGYWWKEEPPAAVEEEQTHPDLGPPPEEEALLAMHPEKFAELLEDYRQYALWKMSPDTVKWYYQMQDFARRRSRAFMSVTELVMLENAEMNMRSVYPITNPGQAARNTQRQSSIDARLAIERDKAALVMLVRQSCPYCEPQRAALKHFQARHGWQIKEIDLDNNPAAIARFGTDFTPTTVAIFRGSNDWVPVAVGVESVPRLEELVYRSIRLYRGETTPEQYTIQDYQHGSPLDPNRSQK